MYCLMHSIAAVVHCSEQKQFILLEESQLGAVIISRCLMRLILIRSKHRSYNVLPPAVLRSCAFG